MDGQNGNINSIQGLLRFVLGGKNYVNEDFIVLVQYLI